MLTAPKRLLYGPGPSMVEARVYQALAQPVVGHLDPFFFEVAEAVRAGLRRVFGTSNRMTLAVSGTGTAGMEAAVANLIEPGDKVAVFVCGYFCERLADMARRHGGEVVRFEKPWGEAVSDEEARQFIMRERPRIVAFVQAETSTGLYTPGKTICDAAHEVEAIVIGDCVTSLGAMPAEVDKNGIDFAYSCTQKGLSCPPGLSPITVSGRALERIRARRRPVDSFYLDLKLLEDYYDGRKYHHTASSSLLYALREALAAIEEEGLERRWERHRRHHLELVRGFEALGMRMLVPEGRRLWNLNTPRVPQGVDEPAVRRHLLERDSIEIAGGFGPLAGKIFRVGLMGPVATAEGVRSFLDAFGRALRDAGGYTPSTASASPTTTR
ncbi:MAG TPA: alanine--glyoxylate aminotransferase family protein [Bryobacteraceae bacterium]|nr:alanine--glyoxylate aminotransferase family protein [Bryobacteraceae bacterium]